MSARLSRPRRTKLYDCNYNMSERYYKPMVDHLDRKYSARPTAQSDIPRHFSPLADGYRRQEQSPAEETRRRPLSTMMDDYETSMGSRSNGHSQYEDDSMTEEMAASMKRIAASKAARAAIEDEISEISAMRNNRKQKPGYDFAEKVLDSVGLNSSTISRARESLEDDSYTKRRTMKMMSSANDDDDNSTITKWTALKGAGQRMMSDTDDEASSAAASRARRSRNRLADLDAEMELVAERSAAREKRNNHLRALVQENYDNSSDLSSSSSATMRVMKTTVKSEKKTVTF